MHKRMFVDLYHLLRGTGEAVTNGILTLLDRNGLDVSKIRGQSYDGTSAKHGWYSHWYSGKNQTIKSSCPLYPLSLSCIEFINSKFLHRTWYL